MALGSSAGRSSGNRTAPGAPRRATQRERAAVDPPADQLVPVVEPPSSRWQLTPRGEKLADALAWGLWLGFCVFFAVIVCAWWGLL